MFDAPTHASDAGAAASLVAATFRSLVEQECRLQQLAAHWAVLHVAADEASRALGGVGTPLVWEFAAAELGALQETTTGAASALMADALDLRHRLPRLWERVRDGSVRVWKARAVAKATRHLSVEAAAAVDTAVGGSITALPWGRFEVLLQAKVVAADPAVAEQRQRLWEADRFVRAGRATEGGLKTLVARANAGDVIWFLAMVGRIAELLHLEGDVEPADVRRSKAIGILAQPAVALDLLRRHAGDPDRHPQSEPREVGDEEGSAHQAVRLETVTSRLQPEELARLRPPAVLHVHVAAETVQTGRGVARVERLGPMLLRQVRTLLGGCAVRVLPVLDPAGLSPVDGYEIPARLREAVVARTPFEVFPWGTRPARAADLDHTVPYLPPARGGPPGQTGLANLGPLSRHHHRAKTFTRWRLRQPQPGTHLWRSPTGFVFLVNAAGTHPLGRDAFSDTVWQAAGTRREAARIRAPGAVGART